jgi:hypothetical protein
MLIQRTIAYRTHSRTPNLAAWVFCILFFPAFALSIFGMFSEVRTTVGYERYWNVSFGILSILMLSSSMVAFFGPQRIQTDGAIKSRLALIAGGLICSVLFAYGAIYSGVPIILHHATATPGSILVTVASKHDTYRKRACSPRLEIEEFSVSDKSYLCVSESAYVAIQIGSKIRIKGKVSPYGVETNEIS